MKYLPSRICDSRLISATGHALPLYNVYLRHQKRAYNYLHVTTVHHLIAILMHVLFSGCQFLIINCKYVSSSQFTISHVHAIVIKGSSIITIYSHHCAIFTVLFSGCLNYYL